MVMVLKSRNTMVASALVFLGVVILLRLTGGLVEENIVRIAGSIFAGNAESVPMVDIGSVNWSVLDPSGWSLDAITQSINGWLHEVIDSVLPAFIYSVNVATVHVAVITRVEWMGALSGAIKGSAAAA